MKNLKVSVFYLLPAFIFGIMFGMLIKADSSVEALAETCAVASPSESYRSASEIQTGVRASVEVGGNFFAGTLLTPDTFSPETSPADESSLDNDNSETPAGVKLNEKVKTACNNGDGNGAETCNASDKGNEDETKVKGDKADGRTTKKSNK